MSILQGDSLAILRTLPDESVNCCVTAIARAVAGVIILALLVCVWALIIDEKCSRHLDENDILWEEVVAAQSAQSNNGGGR